ncbi:rod-binding protein [bacterium]|nr:rod-binding protein [bacterium]
MSEISKLNPIKSAPLAEKTNKVTDDKIRQVADLYEQHFIRAMMKEMRSTVQEGGFIKQNNAEKIFRDQLDDQYSEQWGKAGGIGLSNLIYDQIMDKYGTAMGLKPAMEKPHGPMNLDQKSNFSGLVSGNNTNATGADSMTFKFQSPENHKTEITSPWAGTLLDKKYLEMDQMQYRIKHDNGLESLILTRGTGLGPEQKLSVGDTIAAGQQLGWTSSASPLIWTLKPNVSE